MEKINIDWQKDMTFEAHMDKFNLTLDATVEHGGQGNGPKPKPLILVALAGCTGMDVASLAKKMRVEMKSLKIEVEADKSEERPIVYTSFKVVYRFEGSDHDKDKILKIVRGSQEKYCGVSAMMRHVGPVCYEVYLNGVHIS